VYRKSHPKLFFDLTEEILRLTHMSSDTLNIRPQPDQVLVDTADYVLNYAVTSKLAYDTATSRYGMCESAIELRSQ
jgi:hypothetical protein